MSAIFEAFHRIVANPTTPIAAYVVLWRNEPFYGGPQEGGWWGSDSIVEAFERVSTREEADALCERIEELADRLTAQAARDHGRGCQAQLDWCEARGIDDSNSVFGGVFFFVCGGGQPPPPPPPTLSDQEPDSASVVAFPKCGINRNTKIFDQSTEPKRLWGVYFTQRPAPCGVGE
jgi:hypothetical protein